MTGRRVEPAVNLLALAAMISNGEWSGPGVFLYPKDTLRPIHLIAMERKCIHVIFMLPHQLWLPFFVG